MKKNIVSIFTFLFLVSVLCVTSVAFAADPPGLPLGGIVDTSNIGSGGGGTGKTYADVTSVTSLVIRLINWFAWGISAVSVVIGLYAGFLFITARGETAQLATAKKTLLYAVIGIAVAVMSFSIIAITKIFI